MTCHRGDKEVDQERDSGATLEKWGKLLHFKMQTSPVHLPPRGQSHDVGAHLYSCAWQQEQKLLQNTSAG